MYQLFPCVRPYKTPIINSSDTTFDNYTSNLDFHQIMTVGLRNCSQDVKGSAGVVASGTVNSIASNDNKVNGIESDNDINRTKKVYRNRGSCMGL